MTVIGSITRNLFWPLHIPLIKVNNQLVLGENSFEINLEASQRGGFVDLSYPALLKFKFKNIKMTKNIYRLLLTLSDLDILLDFFLWQFITKLSEQTL